MGRSRVAETEVWGEGTVNTEPHQLTLSAFLAAVRMANLSYNLAQRDSPPTEAEWKEYRRMMRENQAMWDAGEAEVRKLITGEVGQ